MPDYTLRLTRRGKIIETSIELPADGVYVLQAGAIFVAGGGVIRPIAAAQSRRLQLLARRRRPGRSSPSARASGPPIA
jgi:hypothetical protein